MQDPNLARLIFDDIMAELGTPTNYNTQLVEAQKCHERAQAELDRLLTCSVRGTADTKRRHEAYLANLSTRHSQLQDYIILLSLKLKMLEAAILNYRRSKNGKKTGLGGTSTLLKQVTSSYRASIRDAKEELGEPQLSLQEFHEQDIAYARGKVIGAESLIAHLKEMAAEEKRRTKAKILAGILLNIRAR